jgi:hypothetical protein
MPDIVAGTIACIGLCQQRTVHRHQLVPIYGPMMRMREEPTFAEVIAGLCDFYGLQYCHVPDSRKALVTRGWPDFEIWGADSAGTPWRKYVELKAYRGALSIAQRQIGGQLLERGEDWAMWRTLDLYQGTVEKTLMAMSGREAVLGSR